MPPKTNAEVEGFVDECEKAWPASPCADGPSGGTSASFDQEGKLTKAAAESGPTVVQKPERGHTLKF